MLLPEFQGSQGLQPCKPEIPYICGIKQQHKQIKSHSDSVLPS